MSAVVNHAGRVVKEQVVLHRSGDSGVRLCKIQLVETAGRFFEIGFWNDLVSGKLVKVTSTERQRG